MTPANSSQPAIGSQLGPYRIEALLGSGGMGTVYHAVDTRLGRSVAIKIPNEPFDGRFEREARSIAALNHPNICTVHDVGPNYLVMELVEGPTLAELIRKGPMPAGEAMAIARQIADALDAAHEKGIIHRDLKPANIKVKAGAGVKVLDFGLARVARTSEFPSPEDPTHTLTEAWTLAGTPSYMAPEQALGKTVDKRADIWAFGVILYEMLTGSRLFAGATTTDVLRAVLTRDPDWDPVPAGARRLLRLCLEKDTTRRLRDIGDAQALIDEPAETGSQPMPQRAGRTVLWWAVGLLALALLVTGTFLYRARRPVERPLTRLSVDLGPDALAGLNVTVAISPDGRRLVYPVRGSDGRQRLATRTLDQAKPTLLAGTENGSEPFFSPDGQWIGFFGDDRLKKISVQGGAPVSLSAAVNPQGGSWGDDGNIIAALAISGPLLRISASGGMPQILTKLRPGQVTHRWPQVLPGSASVVFSGSGNLIGQEDADVEAMSLKTGEVKVLQRGGYFGRYLPGGYLVYLQRGVLFGLRFDAGRLEVKGPPTRLVEDVAANPVTGGGQFDFPAAPSGSGMLLYRAGEEGAQRWQVSWLDSSGNMRPLLATLGVYTLPRFSLDGRRLAFGSSGDLYVYDLERDTTTRLTSGGATGGVAWAPDGNHLAFVSGTTISWLRSDGAGEPQRLLELPDTLSPWSFSPDGRFLAYFTIRPGTGADLFVLPLDTSDPDHPKPGLPQPFLVTRAHEYLPRFSPDGHWIAYRSDESGTDEIYVRPFPEGSRQKAQISAGGGLYPMWSQKSRQLFYESADHRIMVVDCAADGDAFVPGKPRLWSDRQIFFPGLSNVDLAPDGKRFAVLSKPEAADDSKNSIHVTVLENFLDELKRRIPGGK